MEKAMLRSTIINKILFAMIAVLAMVLALPAGRASAHTVTSFVNQFNVDHTPAKFRIYDISVVSDVGSGDAYFASYTIADDGINNNLGNIAPTHASGNIIVFMLDKELNSGTINHTGRYTVTDYTLDGPMPQTSWEGVYDIPVPLATFEGGVVNLSWASATDEGSGNIVGYNIYRSGDGVSFDATPINGGTPIAVTVTSTTDSIVVTGSTYYYAIKLVYRGTIAVPRIETLYLSANSAPVYVGTVGALIISVDPYFAIQGQTNLDLFIVGSGTHFTATSELNLGPDITVNGLPTWNGDPTQITFNVTVALGAALGSREVIVTTGGEIAVGTGLFWVVPQNITLFFTLTPGKSIRGARINNVKVAGTNTHFTATSEVISDTELDFTWVRAISNVSAEVDLSVAANAQYERKPVFIMTANEFAMGTFEVSLMDMDPELIPNFPNPFDPQVEVTHMMIQLDEPTEIGIYIYDMTARQIWKEVIFLPAGQTPVEWKGYTYFDKIAGNGVYLLRVVDEGNKKLIGKGKIFVIKR